MENNVAEMQRPRRASADLFKSECYGIGALIVKNTEIQSSQSITFIFKALHWSVFITYYLRILEAFDVAKIRITQNPLGNIIYINKGINKTTMIHIFP